MVLIVFISRVCAVDLIWHYRVHSYLLGEPLPPFGIAVLERRFDAHAAGHARPTCVNLLSAQQPDQRDHLTIAGESIDLGRITQPLYAVTAFDDHIAPWSSAIASANM